MSESAETRWQLSADHPVFAGHFPGQPIIPGALLLDHALQCAANRLSLPCRALAIEVAKFLHPAGPDEPLTFEIEPGAARDTWRFRLKTERRVLVQGVLRRDETETE